MNTVLSLPNGVEFGKKHLKFLSTKRNVSKTMEVGDPFPSNLQISILFVVQHFIKNASLNSTVHSEMT